jgi:uncharacterized membrane protein
VFKASYLWRGLPGHPLHPPLTDVTVGTYTVATALAFADVLGISDNAAAGGWWLALLFGLVVTVLTALTGLLDWLQLEWRSPIWWTATWHMLSMVTATVFFGLAAIFGHAGWQGGDVTTGPFVLTLLGFGFLTLGGWLGGSVVFVHGMRVLNLVDERPERAVSPVPKSEKEAAERA